MHSQAWAPHVLRWPLIWTLSAANKARDDDFSDLMPERLPTFRAELQ
jgi:hypothetical protein